MARRDNSAHGGNAKMLYSKNAKQRDIRPVNSTNVKFNWNLLKQSNEVKFNWNLLKQLLIQNFAHQNVTQSALQQLNALTQKIHEQVAQFSVKMNQLLLRADPSMSEEMKLYFLWPRLHYDISRRVRDQGPTTFHVAIQIAQRIEAST